MDSALRRRSLNLLLPALGLCSCAFLWVAVLTFHVADWPTVHQFPRNETTANACGLVGAWFAYYLRVLLGDGVFPLLLFLTLAALLKLAKGQVGNLAERAFGLVLVVACTSASAHLIAGPGAGPLPVGSGGLSGYALGELLRQNLDRLGTLIVVAASFFVGLLFTTEGWVLKLPAIVGRAAQLTRQAATAAKDLKRLLQGPAVAAAAGRVGSRGATTQNDSPRRPGVRKQEPMTVDPDDAEALDDDDNAATGPQRVAAKKRHAFEVEETSDEDTDEDEPAEDAHDTVDEDEEVGEAEPETERRLSDTVRDGSKSDSGTKARRALAADIIVNFPKRDEGQRSEWYPRHIENWTLPSLDLLQEPEYGFTQQQEQFVREQARVLERTLEEFRLDARVVEIDTGPVITMFELKLGVGIKVSQIATLANDIARALKVHAIRVVAPIPGKNTVGIEVPNVQKEKVRLKELMASSGKRASEMMLPLFLGKDAGGQALVTDLTKMPHMLIAGTTGSGKSVCLNTVILSLVMTKRPDHVKMILIDPKMVEMTQFKDVPHLMCPLVTDIQKAEKILEWAVTKMDERYELLAEAGVRNIAGYNELTPEQLYTRFAPENEDEKKLIATFLPYLVIVIDELADLMMTAGKEVEHHLSRLAQKSRAVGIHIIVATQRPEVRVVTGLIKSNLPSRICFRVASRMDSRIVLDQNGGEVLLGQGDMLFLPPGQHKLIRAQGTYLEDAELHAVIQDVASRAQPEYHPELMRLKTSEEADLDGMRDPLFEEAVEIILQSKRGSVSLLQRKLTIGYSRASRLIEQMAAAGIVGEYKGSQAREVLVTYDEWEALKAQVSKDMQANYAADQVDDHSAEHQGDHPGLRI